MKNIVKLRTGRKPTRELDSKKKFKHFSGIRLIKLRNIMRSVRNLSNKRYYDYDENQRKQIMKDMNSWYHEMYNAWKNAGRGRRKEPKKSYWDMDNGNNDL